MVRLGFEPTRSRRLSPPRGCAHCAIRQIGAAARRCRRGFSYDRVSRSIPMLPI